MSHRILTAIALVTAGVTVLTACTGKDNVAGTPMPAPTSSSNLPNSGAPKVDDPLPAKVRWTAAPVTRL